MVAPSQSVTLVFVANCYTPGNKASLWFAPGAHDLDADDTPYYDELPGSRKLIGPIDAEECTALFSSLITAFKDADVAVASFETADD